MKKTFLASAALMALATCGSAASYISMERINVWDGACQCTKLGIKVRDNDVTTNYFVGDHGLTANMVFDEDQASAYVASLHGREADAIYQPGGRHIDPVTGEEDHDAGSW